MPKVLQTKIASGERLRNSPSPQPAAVSTKYRTRITRGTLAPDAVIQRSNTIQRSAASSKGGGGGGGGGGSAAAAAAKDESKQDFSKFDDKWWPKAYRLNGPYAALDLWDTYQQVSRFRDFSAHQRGLLIAANKLRNGGVLKSDADNDPYTNLNETLGQDDSAEVDHVIHKLGGGSNHWWNARLISRKLNNSMERNVVVADKKL